MAHLSYYETTSVHISDIEKSSAHPSLKYNDFMGVPQLPEEVPLSTTHRWIEDSCLGSPGSGSSSLSSQSSPLCDFGEILSMDEFTQHIESSSIIPDSYGTWYSDAHPASCHSSFQSLELHKDFSYLPGDLYQGTEDQTSIGLALDFSASSPISPTDSVFTSSPIPEALSPELLEVSLPRTSAGRAIAKVQALYQDDSELDAEGETDEEDDDNDTDDEYIPPSLPSLTQRRSYRNTRTSVASSSQRTSRYSPPKSPRTSRPTKSAYTERPSPRMSSPVVSFDDTIPFRTAARRKEGKGVPNYTSTNENGDFCCETCDYVFKPNRRVDFVRHVKTHYPELTGGPLICCGIPVEDRYLPKYKRKIRPGAEVMTFYGRKMVGGCGKAFSRTDALQRHLDLATKRCVADLAGDWHPPKRSN